MESIAPTAQVVPPSFCSYSGAVMIERIELPDVQLNSTLTPIECAPAPHRLNDGKPNTEAYTEGRRETDAVIGRGNIEYALAFRMDRQGQGQSIESRYMKYGLQDKFDKIHGRVIVVIEDNVPHTRTLYFYLILFEEIESRFPDGSNSVWILLL